MEFRIHNPAAACCRFLLIVSLVFATMATPAADRVSREAVEALEAYAVYKMAQYPEAYSRFLALARKGNVQGMLNAANMLQAGLGTERDEAAALDWYRKAAERGSAIGMFYTAMAYLQGRGAEADSSRAQRWLQQAAEAGSTEAQLEFGKLLRQQGAGAEGLAWIRRAADNGDSLAAVYLAAVDSDEAQDSPIGASARALIENAWAAIDRAAANRNAPGTVYYLAHDADIRVKLPGAGNWTPMSKNELQEFWRSSFARSDDYSMRRGDLGYRAQDDRIAVVSSIDEEFGFDSGDEKIRLEETALVRIENNRVVIERLNIILQRR